MRHVYCTVHSPDEFITWLDHESSLAAAARLILRRGRASKCFRSRRPRPAGSQDAGQNETRLTAASARPPTRHTLPGIHLLSRLASASIDLFIDRYENRPGRMRTASRMRRCSGERRLLSCKPPHRAAPRRAVKRQSYPGHIDAP